MRKMEQKGKAGGSDKTGNALDLSIAEPIRETNFWRRYPSLNYSPIALQYECDKKRNSSDKGNWDLKTQTAPATVSVERE